jgi:mono/diheme cytochrome c family protein
MRKVISTGAAGILLIILGGAGFIYSGIYDIGADQPHWSATSWLLDEARTRSIAFHAAGIGVPADLDDRTKLLVGVAHFADHCAVCHGAPGVPQGDLAQGLYPRPPNLAGVAAFYTPGEVFWIIKHGIKMSGMPAWGDHSDDELWATVAFLRKLPGMTEQDYARLVKASRATDGHQH